MRGREAVLDGLAYHAIASGNAAKGLPLAIAAADAALAAGALDRAQAHCLAGLKLLGGLSDTLSRRDTAWALLNKYGLACIVDPAFDQLPALEQLLGELEQHGTDRDLQRADYWLGSIAYGVGLGKRSVRHLEAAHGRAEAGGRSADLRLIQTKLAHSLFASGRIAESVEQFEAELPGLAVADGRNDRELSAYAYAGYAFLNAERGDFSRAATLFAQADAILGDPSSAINASILLYRSATLVVRGDWGLALVAADAVLAASQRSRARMQNRTSRAQAAYARWQLGRDRIDAEMLEQIAREFLIGGNSRQHLSMVLGWVVEVMAELGDTQLARGYMTEVTRRVRESGDRLGEAMGWRAMARIAAAASDPSRADRHLDFARRSADIRLSRREAAHNLACEADLLLARGENAIAGAMRASAAREFQAMDMPFFAGRTTPSH